MTAHRIPLVALVLLCLVFLGYLVASADQLPPRMATHFNGEGQPDGWMPRSTHLVLMGVTGLWLPLSLTGLGYVMRFLPTSGFNLPNREYWLAPERRQHTMSYFFGRFLWLACMMECFFIGLQFLVVQANTHAPAEFSTPAVLVMNFVLLAGIVAWAVPMVRHFRSIA
jgi:uncharacterized membrane protein